MTIPNLPWWASDAQREFEKTGWMSETAVAAGIAGAFWDSDLCGKSNIVILPFINKLSMPGGQNADATPGTFAGRSTSTAIYSPNYRSSVAPTNYVSNRDMGFRGPDVTHSQVKERGLDPSQVLVTGRSIKVAISCEVDYHGYFGYLLFSGPSLIPIWQELKHIDDVGPSGYSTYSFVYDLPIPRSNEIILPAFKSERGVKNLTLGVGGYEGDLPVAVVTIELTYTGITWPYINYVTGSVVVNNVSGNFYGDGYTVGGTGYGGSTENYIGIRFAANPGVNKIILKSVFDGGVAYILTRKKTIVSTTYDYSQGYPPKPINTYAESETEYETEKFTINSGNYGQQTQMYRVAME